MAQTKQYTQKIFANYKSLLTIKQTDKLKSIRLFLCCDVEKMIESGNGKALEVTKAMAYQIAKEIGAMAKHRHSPREEFSLGLFVLLRCLFILSFSKCCRRYI